MQEKYPWLDTSNERKYMLDRETCPNIEVEIDVTDKSPFFIRPHHGKEDKNFIDKEMKRLFT